MLVELHDAVALGVAHVIAEDRGSGAPVPPGNLLEPHGEPLAEEHVVAEDEGDTVVADESLADDEGLRQSLGARLLRVVHVDADARPVPQQLTKAG